MKRSSNYLYGSVMIIDDNAIDRYIAQKVIESSHYCYHILTYHNAAAALQYLTAHQEDTASLPEIIFVDIYMPEMSGFEFMEAYDRLSPTLKAHCAVYIVSSTMDPEDLKRINDNPNVAAFHVKPLDAAFLSQTNRKTY